MVEDNDHIITGPKPFAKIADVALGVQYYKAFLSMPKESVAMVDVFNHEKLSYSTLLEKSVRLAETLRSNGYSGQDTVISISSENSLSFFIPVLASLYNLSIIAPLNHSYTSYELEHCLKISSPKVVFCSQAIASTIVNLKQKLGFIEEIILIGSKGVVEGTTPLDDYIKNTNVSCFQPLEGFPGKLCALIMCSSGTTGLPKGVAISHLGINTCIANDKDPKFQIVDSKTCLGMMPFFHGNGMMFTLIALMKGSTVVVLKQFDEDRFLKSIENYKIAYLQLVPPLALFLAKSEKVLKYDLSCVKTVLCGSAPLSKSVEAEVKSRLNCYDFRQAYGISEMTLAVTMIEQGQQRPGASGKPLPYVSLKIRDVESGRSLPANESGEVCLKGSSIMLGYYKNPEATKATFTSDGWFRTGDIAYYDNDGYVYIVDRLKELIKCDGYQVAPAELEAILINHPKVADVGVVGLPDQLVGEKPLAFIVKKVGQGVSKEEIQKYVEGFVSTQKRLSGGVIFIETIPKNPSGKILRRELRLLLNSYSISS